MKHGEAESQGSLEAAALAMGIWSWLWADKIRGSSVLIAVARKLTGASPALNFVGAALSAFLEKAQVPKLVTHHVAGVLNTEADWRSRPSKPAEDPVPAALRGVKICLNVWRILNCLVFLRCQHELKPSEIVKRRPCLLA